MPGSGFVPSDLIGARMGLMARILAATDAYAAFVGAEAPETPEEVTALAEGMYFDGIDRRDLIAQATEEEIEEVSEADLFPPAFVIWGCGDDAEFFSTQAGGTSFKWRGSVTLTVEADTPEEFWRNTPGAYNWIRGQVSAMLLEMKEFFGDQEGHQDVDSFRWEGPYRSPESDGRDFVSMVVVFDLRT